MPLDALFPPSFVRAVAVAFEHSFNDFETVLMKWKFKKLWCEFVNFIKIKLMLFSFFRNGKVTSFSLFFTIVKINIIRTILFRCTNFSRVICTPT